MYLESRPQVSLHLNLASALDKMGPSLSIRLGTVAHFCEVTVLDTLRAGWRNGAGRGSVIAEDHQQPDVNFIQVLEKVDFPCTVNAQHLPFKGNQLRAQTG